MQFLVFIGLVIALSAALIVSRLPDCCAREAKLDSLLSREAFFLLNNLVLVGLCLVIFWGTFFPLISEAVTGTEASVGPPWFNRLVTPLALVLVLLTGIGPVLAWRRFTPAGAAADARGAAWRPWRWRWCCCSRSRTPPTARPSLAMFCLVAFVLAVVGQELWRGTRGAPDDDRRVAGRARSRGSPGATGAATAASSCTRGSPCCSSAWPRRRRSSTSATCACRPGDTFEVDGYQVTYREATAKLGGDSAGTGAPISFGAVLDVRKDGKRFTMRPSRNFYASGDPSLGTISRFFEGEATSEVDVRWGLQPRPLARGPPRHRARSSGRSARPTRKFADSPGDVQALIVAALAERYRRDPPPAAFRAIASPLVVWIWIGGAIVVLGALVAAWPSPEARLRRVRSLYSARLGRELSRA